MTPIDQKLIIVHYVGVGNSTGEEVIEAIKKAKKDVVRNKKLKDHILYFIPIKGESRVECIYPKQ